MDFKERGLLEFKALQDEMLENSKKIYQIVGITITGSAGIIGYCFSTKGLAIAWSRPFALLSPFLILIPAMILIQSNQFSTVRIAGFVKVRFEEFGERELPGWQTALQWVRETGGPVRRAPADKTTLLTLTTKPSKPAGRHLHKGLSVIMCGIAVVSSLGSALACWWLIYHHDVGGHFWWKIGGNTSVLLFAWVLFRIAHREMSEGWQKDRFVEWQGHWREWVSLVESDRRSS